METLQRLETNRDALLEQYRSNLDDVYNLQDTLIQEILPSVSDELQLAPEIQDWAKEWLSDTLSIFRISRRNKFTRSFSLEAIQKNLLWRLTNLWPVEPPLAIPNLHCLPDNIRDPFGRPVLVLEVVAVDESTESQKLFIIRAFETLRIHLRKLYEMSEDNEKPSLQYVALLDLSQLSLQSLNIDLFTWTLREVIPRFPGMIAAVFMLNYSWTHAGLWSVFKRLLPEVALSRIFFPSNQELLKYFGPSNLPQDYGGILPPLSHLEDPIRPEQLEPQEESDIAALASEPEPTLRPNPSFISISWLSPTSLLNPFFGYPVLSSSRRGPVSFRHGRRRKRDLVRTLAMLFWMRWRRHITALLCVTIMLCVLKRGFRKGNSRFPASISHWLLSNRRLASN
ncbi:hypothetical protein M413DRAFT_441999 [Hebeloma cylindrosporum]|uniref:CRAL-TRIO domain-containing protein n=1 Tax=Hebeloma cylindrosporum TaxID=76867 RepID=A0A0C2Y638_HEBCY|nr:hypothetical protein M413DRAFT_441999 [Hebeloma cylindrosporum h7]